VARVLNVVTGGLFAGKPSEVSQADVEISPPSPTPEEPMRPPRAAVKKMVTSAEGRAKKRRDEKQAVEAELARFQVSEDERRRLRQLKQQLLKKKRAAKEAEAATTARTRSLDSGVHSRRSAK
jgi:hypothetical protein